MNDSISRFIDWLERRRGRVFGAAFGLVLGWMIAAYGFWKTLFIASCLFAGYIVGTWLDEGPPVRRTFRRR